MDRSSEVRARRSGRKGHSVQHTCEFCSRTFKRTEHLTRHLRTHTKEKPFECHCGANFTRRDLLTRHWRLADHSPKVPAAPTEADRSLVRKDSIEPQASSSVQYEIEAQLPTLDTQLQGTTEEFDQGDCLSDFQSFFNFIDNVGLFAEWTPENAICGDTGEQLETPQQHRDDPISNPPVAERYGTPFGAWLPSAPTNNEMIGVIADPNICTERTTRGTVHVTSEQSRSLGILLEDFRSVIPDFRMPSRHTLSRYLTSFFVGFHSHLLFIHQPTYKPSLNPIELTLAMCAAGAQYCFERRNADELFQAAQAITFERIRHEGEKIGPQTHAFVSMINPESIADEPPPVVGGPWSPLDTLKTLLILVGYATWGDNNLLKKAFNLRVMMIRCLRDLGLEEDGEDGLTCHSSSRTAEWDHWVQRESARRTKLVSFCYVNVHSIAYNVYPELWGNELVLRLPCSTQEWQAPTAARWSRAQRESGKEQMSLHEATKCLLEPQIDLPNGIDPVPSPLGNYILLHALIQRIQIVRELSLANSIHIRSIPSTELHTIGSALRSWTSIWQQAPESVLDPSNENGPVPFTSSALLGVAYVRLSLDIGPLRHLETRQPEAITASLTQLPPIERNSTLISALLYCTHALSIPVRLGVDRISRSEAFFWSVQHALASFECGVFLSKWLCSLENQTNDMEFTSSINHILHWVRRIVEEAYAAVDFGPTRLDVPTQSFGLGLAVLRIWCRFFQNNSQWDFVVILGKSLEGFSLKLQEDAAFALEAVT